LATDVSEHGDDPHTRDRAVQVIACGREHDRNAALREGSSEAPGVVSDAAATALLDDQHAARQIVLSPLSAAAHVTRHRGTLA
jgi:hypothetical protein